MQLGDEGSARQRGEGQKSGWARARALTVHSEREEVPLAGLSRGVMHPDFRGAC